MDNFKPRKFLLLSRFNEKRYLLEIEPQIFKILGDTDYMRIIMSEDGKSIQAIDFTGGPMIGVGDIIQKRLYIKGISFRKEDGEILIWSEN